MKEVKSDAGWKWRLRPNVAEDGRALQVGMKQLPGAKGLGLGHGNDGSDDPNFDQLREWIGDDWRTYQQLG